MYHVFTYLECFALCVYFNCGKMLTVLLINSLLMACACQFRLICQFITTMDMTFLPAYKPSEEEKKDPALFAENVRKLMVSIMALW